MIRANQKFQNIFKQREFHLGWNRQSQQHYPIFKGLVVLVKYLDPSLKTFNEKTFPTVLQIPSTIFYERLNNKAPLELESFKHLSKKRHDHSPQFEKNIYHTGLNTSQLSPLRTRNAPLCAFLTFITQTTHFLTRLLNSTWGYSPDASTKYAPSALFVMEDYTTPFSTVP
jgi:hypothetical protein